LTRSIQIADIAKQNPHSEESKKDKKCLLALVRSGNIVFKISLGITENTYYLFH